PGGRVTLVGMPGPERIDLAPLWQREIELVGAYAYGSENPRGPGGVPGDARGPGGVPRDARGPGGVPRDDRRRRVRTFDLAFDLVADAGLGRLVSARYPLERYREAIGHASTPGGRGAVHIVL